MIRISAIVLNWNGKHFLQQCLESILSQATTETEVILVDNHSTDGSVDFVRSQYPRVKIITNEKNYGFCKAANIGIQSAVGEFIALFNNDIVVLQGWFSEMIAAINRDPKIAMCASKMLLLNHKNIIHSAGLEYNFFCASSIGFNQADTKCFNQEKFVFGACAGAAFYRKSLFDAIGYFDEDFFITAEDSDLSFRANLAGFRCIYVPTAVVYHYHMGTIGDLSFQHVFYCVKNPLHLVVKNVPTLFFILYAHKFVIFLLSTVCSYALAGRGMFVLKGLMRFLIELPRMLYKRVFIQASIKISASAVHNIIVGRSYYNS